MLGAIRKKSKGWVAYLIVGLISVPFALFGIQEYYAGIDGIYMGRHFPGLITLGDFLGVVAVPM